MALTNYVVGTTAHPGGTWTIENTNTAQTGRYHDLAGLLEGSSAGFATSRPGCFPGAADSGTETPSCFAQNPAGGLSVSMRAGAAAIERGTLVGPYIVVSEAVATVTLATADATNPRIDRIDLQVLDGILGDNGGSSQTAFVVTTGTAAGVPVAPAAPANSIPISQIHLPANTLTITGGMVFDVRRSAGIRGAIRVMLPGDSTADAGFGSGEWRDTAAVPGAIDTIDRWRQDTATWETMVDRTGATSQYTQPSVAIANLTSTGYLAVKDTSANVITGAIFIAPASGKVWIDFGMGVHPASGDTVTVSIAVLTGGTLNAGTSITAAVDNNAFASSASALTVPGAHRFLQTGLTPGSTYNTFVLWKSTSTASASAAHSYISVMPIAK